MRPFPKALFIALSILMGFGAGFGLRAWRHVSEAAPEILTSRISKETAPAAKSGKLPLQPASALVSKTTADLSLSSGVTRWLVWMTAVEKAELADFPSLARLGKSLPGAVRMLFARWMDLSPQHLFESCQLAKANADFPGDELLNLLFEEWPKRDPEAAIKALSVVDNPMSNLRYNVINALMSQDPERAIIALSDWQIDNYGPDMAGVAKWAEKDPQHATTVALLHPVGYATQMILKAIGKVWGQRDPAAALQFASDQPGKDASDLANEVMATWASHDLAKASAWLADQSEATRNQLLPHLIEAWGKEDPAAALQWCQANATGLQQAKSIVALVKGAAARDLTSAANTVASLEDFPASTQAAAAFAAAAVGKWFPGYLSNEGVQQATSEGLAWLTSLNPTSRRSALEVLQWHWSSSDPKGLAAFLSTPAGQNAGPKVVSSVVRSLTRQNPAEGMAWASQLSAQARPAAQSEAFWEWRQTQPEAAYQWLTKLPRNDPSRQPLIQQNVSLLLPVKSGAIIAPEVERLTDLILTDPFAARTAINSLSIPEANRNALRQLLP